MDWLTGALSSSGLGAIVGMVGGFAEKWVDIKAKRMQYNYDLRMREHDIQESSLERTHEINMANKQMERAEVEGDIKISSIEADAFVASQQSAGKCELLTYIRAAITLFMLVVSTALSLLVWDRVGGIDAMTMDQLTYLLNQIVNTILFLTVTCVAWWFAARASNMKFSK